MSGRDEDFNDFLATPRQRPSEIERARMRRVLSGLTPNVSKPGDASSSDAVLLELRAMRSELSRLQGWLAEQMQGAGVPVQDEVLTRSQAAKLLRVCSESVTKLVRDEGLPCLRVGKEYRFLRSKVVSWLAARAAVSSGDE